MPGAEYLIYVLNKLLRQPNGILIVVIVVNNSDDSSYCALCGLSYLSLTIIP